MLSFLVDKVFNTGTPNNSNKASPPSEYHSGRYRTPPSSSLNAQSFRSTNHNASSPNHSGNPKHANGRNRLDNSKFCIVRLPERGNVEINIKKTESQQKNTQNCKTGIKMGKVGGQNYNKSKLGSQNNGKPLNQSANTNTNQKTNSSNSQTGNKTKFAPKNKQTNLDVRRKTEKRNN